MTDEDLYLQRLRPEVLWLVRVRDCSSNVFLLEILDVQKGKQQSPALTFGRTPLENGKRDSFGDFMLASPIRKECRPRWCSPGPVSEGDDWKIGQLMPCDIFQ